jgi:hypothetical protein
MSKILRLDAAGVPPDPAAVLRGQGVPEHAEVPPRVRRLVDPVRKLYAERTEPRGIHDEVSTQAFEAIYRGEGRNAPRTPLESIFPRAERLALFAVTLGPVIVRTISDLFAENEPALGSMLDSVASDRADHAAELIAAAWLADLKAGGAVGDRSRVLHYSPGYCGWHVSGQRRLFDRLNPGRIGISLNESCLMQPLKSVSGVLVAGPAEIHAFDNDFDFCDTCANQECRARIASVSAPPARDSVSGGLECNF